MNSILELNCAMSIQWTTMQPMKQIMEVPGQAFLSWYRCHHFLLPFSTFFMLGMWYLKMQQHLPGQGILQPWGSKYSKDHRTHRWEREKRKSFSEGIIELLIPESLMPEIKELITFLTNVPSQCHKVGFIGNHNFRALKNRYFRKWKYYA